MAYCSKCGNELIDSAVYCNQCGTRSQNDISDLSSSLDRTNKLRDYPFKKNWASAWVLIGSILSPFRVLQILSTALGFYLVMREQEKYESRTLTTSLDTTDVDKYIAIQIGIGFIHILYAIVAFYFYSIENGLAFWL